jgi:hypothetical protein
MRKLLSQSKRDWELKKNKPLNITKVGSRTLKKKICFALLLLKLKMICKTSGDALIAL